MCSTEKKKKKEEEKKKLEIQQRINEYNRIIKQTKQDELKKQENFETFKKQKEGTISSNYQQLPPAQNQSQHQPQHQPQHQHQHQPQVLVPVQNQNQNPLAQYH